MYRDRAEAGRRLLQRLRERVSPLAGPDLVILGLAPGGVLVAREIAQALGAALDVTVAVRLPSPGNHVSIGGVAAGGIYRLDERTVRMLGVSDEYIAEAVRLASENVERQQSLYRAGRAAVPLAGRRVIVVDDGAQPRFRSRAALARARELGARQVIFAVPVASSDALAASEAEADLVVSDYVPERHCGIGAYYGDSDIPRAEMLRSVLARPLRAAPLVPSLGQKGHDAGPAKVG
jgi:predicted phosphoribosyltransferase